MERNNRTTLLFGLFAMLQVCTVTMDQNCPSHPDKHLTCYNDFSRNITCVWNGINESDHTDAVCTLHAVRIVSEISRQYRASCVLEPVVGQALKKCSLIFKKDGTFQSFHVLSMNLSCNPAKKNYSISYKPSCHVKLNPPSKPDINNTTVSWPVETHGRITFYRFELQWKKGDESWSGPSVNIKTKECKENCQAELDLDHLIQGERYEARVRVQASEKRLMSTWSEWSPTASWVSSVGRTKSPPPSDFAGSVFGIIVTGTAFALFLAVVLFRSHKTTWVDIVKRVKGQPIPDPAKSFLQNWLSPQADKAFHSSKMEEIISVEVSSTVDVVTLCESEAALLEKIRSESGYESTSSSFSNPSYSQLCTPPVSLPAMANLELCANNAPNGPVGRQGEGKTAEQNMEEEIKKQKELLQMFSKDNSNSEQMQVISNYEKVEKLQVERFRLDSGICSEEEVSQESLEANEPDSHDKGPEGKEQERGGRTGIEIDFWKLSEGSGSVFGKGSIQVCPDYERVQQLQPGSPELPSMDSGVSSGGEEQLSHEESLEDTDKSSESSSFLFPPPLPCTLPCSMTFFPHLPLKFSGTGLSPAVQPPFSSQLLGGLALTSVSRSMEPSGDGYMPVRQEES
ncbi:uncharacterized protein LOC121181144 [Toxotes jaculatrix]|uniref:uncharacterized protein LOC121181144 n=1 Tax=Toxotes jaculatrix TaxID=941984 RepID=UPI001B3A7F45|nr:uncharacterized protein LOC121181144 [Toxotes jaculatrix]XP_040892903.1 uncharacterized protein LOC121181144 [Toxotes jaculatrix]XP_040892904.1 uncharacterized protein LOC121181144 [Toxotes jaculatrix]